MPAEYPGLYWDETRNRYFPLSSRPTPSTNAPITTSQHHRLSDDNPNLSALVTHSRPSQSEHFHFVPWHTHLSRISESSYTQTIRNSHDLLCFHYSNTSACSTERLPTLGPIQAFSSTRIDGKICQFAGDNQGWVYSRTALDSERINAHRWSAEPILRSSESISSISTSDTHCVVTCLGPGKVSVQSVLSPDGAKKIENKNIQEPMGVELYFDTRYLDLEPQRAEVGAGKASYLADVDRTRTPQHLITNSDVFSVAQDDTLVYLGTRSGSVHRFDMRMPKHCNQKLFDNRFGKGPRSSVLHLDVMREYEIFMSHMNGDLVVYDLRFSPITSTAAPIRVFEGHVNTHTRNLGLAIDRDHDFLYAAGQDQRIRAWSLRTGTRLTPSQPSASAATRRVKQTNPLLETFSDQVFSLQVVEEPDAHGHGRGGGGVSLWAAAGRQVYQYRLGQRWGD